MALSPEERQRIYEEEKAKLEEAEARRQARTDIQREALSRGLKRIGDKAGNAMAGVLEHAVIVAALLLCLILIAVGLAGFLRRH
jgi:hypothetical protein